MINGGPDAGSSINLYRLILQHLEGFSLKYCRLEAKVVLLGNARISVFSPEPWMYRQNTGILHSVQDDGAKDDS
jgi:hypothetical protein